MSTVLIPGPALETLSDPKSIGDSTKPSTVEVVRVVAVYLATIVISVLLFFLIRSRGEGLIAPGVSGFGSAAPETQIATFAHVLLALLVVLAVSRLSRAVFRVMHQPAVIGEIVAGIMLGPSLLGYIAPGISSYLFPASLAPSLNLISQAGVVVFMFLIGLEFNPRLLMTRSHAALAISHASIIVPFLLGSSLALVIYPTYATGDVPFTVFAMFMGISLSVTAFPVLARILTERRLQATDVGTVALTCAAVDDATAWCLLAVFIGVAQAMTAQGFFTAYLTIAYVMVMFGLVRPLFVRLVRRFDDAVPSQGALALVMTGMLLSSLATEFIGIHAIFGAFLMGAIIPHDTRLARRLVDNLENVVVVVLLPMFFAFTGLRTQIGLINGASAWLLCGVLILLATLGKFGGSIFAARFTGMRWREAAILATLMNTRGLMELIVLNIGLDLKILSPALFAMLVIMALVTTFLTTPVLDLLYRGHQSGERRPVTIAV